MNPTRFLHAARRHRPVLERNWVRRFGALRAANADPAVVLPPGLVMDALDAMLEAFTADFGDRALRGKLPRRFAELVDFPACAGLATQFYQAGAQVLAAFIAENAGENNAAWSLAARDQLIAELDAVFHVLTHETIEGLGRLLFDDFPRPGSIERRHPGRPLRRLIPNPALRN